MNELEALKMLERYKATLEIYNKYATPYELTKHDVEQIIIMIRSYLMTFEKGGYPFD